MMKHTKASDRWSTTVHTPRTRPSIRDLSTRQYKLLAESLTTGPARREKKPRKLPDFIDP